MSNFYDNYRKNKNIEEEETLESMGYNKKEKKNNTHDFFQNYLKNKGYEYTTQSQKNKAISAARNRSTQPDYAQISLDRKNQYQEALELAKANAGDNRTTATSNAASMRQATNPYGLPVYKGLNTAENGADVDQNKFKTEAATQNGYKGLIGTKSQEQTISKEQSLAHANEVYAPYKSNSEVTNLLNQYVSTNDDLENLRMHGASADQKYHYVREKQKLEKEIRNITGLSKDDFNQIAENYTYLRHDEERKAQQEKLDNASGLEKAALTGLNVATSAIGNYQSAVGLLKKPNDEELGRDYNSVTLYWRNLSSDTKEAVHKDIDESTMADYQKALAGFGYDAFTIGAESAASQLLGGAGLASFFAGGYASSLEEAEQRGLTKGQAQGYALVSGGLEYATEKLPWNNLKAIYSGKAIGKDAVKGSLKPYVKALFKQAGEEAGEEVINGVGDILADALINADKSKVNIAINNYMAEGLSEEEATRKAFFDEGKNILYAAASAAVSAGASAGPALAMEAYGTTKAGRNIADYENKTGNLTRNVENEVYISENREDYDSDEAYNQAMQTRADILAASEKIAKNEKLKGKEARALYESYANIERGTKQEKEVNKTENVKPEEEEIEKPKKSYAQIVEDIEFASTPYQLATAIDQVTEETEEIRELIDYKKKELEMFNFKPEEIDNAITEKKALEMGNKGEEVTAEQLEKIPVQDRQKVLEANNQAYNKSILKEHPDAVVDKSTGKYFVPAEVKVEGADVVITDTDGNTHSDFENPRINQVMQLVTKTSVDMRGHATDQSMYSTNVEQATYAIELAVKSPEATSALVRTAVESILDTASVGHKSWEEYLKNSKGLFTKVDEATAEKLYKSIQKPARKSDSRKTENVEGKKTSDKVVSDTLRENLPEETVSLLEALGKKIGYNFVASTNPNARGSITPGTRQISIGTNSLDELWSITAHEAIAEYLQAHGNEADVTAIQDDMLKYLENKLGSKAFNDLINQYQTVYRESAKKGSVDENKSRRAAANEMFNDTVFALVSSEEGVKDYLDWLNGNNTEASFFQKVKDFFSKLFDYVSNYIQSGSFNAAERAALEMDLKTAKEFRDRLFKLMDDAIENASASETNKEMEKSERNSFGGIRANTSDLKSLATAQDMQAEGKSMRDIFAKTGWYQGADGKWKFEISNRNSELYVNGAAKLADTKEYEKYLEDIDYINTAEVDDKWVEAYERSFNYNKEHNLNDSEYRLDEILKNDELFKAYPTLATIKVKFAKLSPGTNGQYNPVLNEITLDKDLKAYRGEKTRAKRTIFHELQHAIQRIEDFAFGSSPTYWENHKLPTYYDREEKKKYEDAVNKLEKIEKKAPADFLERYHNYRNLLARYGGLTDNEDLYEMAQDIETELREENEKLFDKLDDASFKVDILSPELKELTANEAYYATAGEIEAREVSDRLDLSEEEARNTLPKTTDEEGRVVFSENPLFPWSYPDTRFSKKVDEAYNIAVEENNTELMEKLVETAAVNAGFDSTKLYHGTQSFGFTKIDLERMDDKQSIFLTSNPNIASTYSGTSQKKSIDQAFKKDITKLSTKEIAENLNEYLPDDGIERNFEYYNQKLIRELHQQNLKDIAEINSVVSNINLSEDEKYYKTIEALKSTFRLHPYDEILDSDEIQKTFGTHLYILANNADFLDQKTKDKLNQVEQNIRKEHSINDEYSTSKADELIVESDLDGYSFEVYTRFEAIQIFGKYVNSGIYSLYAKLNNSFVVDANGAYWNKLLYWADEYTKQFNKDNTSVMIEDGRAYLIAGDNPIFDVQANEAFTSQSAEEQHEDILNRFYHNTRIYLDYGHTTRDVSKWAIIHGYDSVIFKNIKDNGGRNYKIDYDELSDVYIIFNPNNVKSADPITYDDEGNIIPLSERFNVNENDLRYSIKVDSAGRELSKGQQEYFKDSKVVDEEGRLKVVYHGTEEEFYTFNPVEKGGKNGRAEGYGIYFAENQEITNAYGNRQLEGYLNMTKPAYSYKKTIKPAELAKLIEATCKAEAKMLMEDGGYDDIKDAIKDTWVSNVVDTYSMSMKQAYLEAAATEIKLSSSDMDIIIGVMNDAGVHNYEEAYDFYKILKDTLGFDGYITEWETARGDKNTIYVAFDSNQFKQIDNLNPTEDADIRKSIKVDNQGRELSKGQQEYFKNSKVINDNGDLMVLYHGSEQPGFTKFGNPKNWFTTNRDVAASYAASNNNIILDNVKSLDRLNELLSDTDYSVEQKNGKYVLYEQGFIDTREIDSFKTLEDTINAANEALSEFDEGRIYEAYINLTNPLEVDAQSKDFDNIEYDGNVYQTFELADYAKDNGYDGLIIRNVNDPGPYSEYAEEGTESDIVVAFNPNQIKSVDNDNPTENEDIRYSKKVNSDGDPLSVQQQEVFKDTKAVDKKGNLLVLYHGSQERFNTFDMNVKGAVNGRAFGNGYYFTPDEQIAKSWGDKNIYKVYLNITKPYYANKTNNVPADVKKLIRNRYEQSYENDHAHINARLAYISEVKNAYDALEVLNRYNMLDAIKSLGYDGIIYDKPEDKDTVQYVAFYPDQIKRTDNYNPIVDSSDIRNSIKVDWDNKNTYKLPERNYEDTVFFTGTDEEVEDAERQEVEAKAYIANIIHSKGFAGLMFTDSIGLNRLLTRSTREGYDWQLTESRKDGTPVGHESYRNENDDITSYDTWPDKTLAALYNEIIRELPMKDAVIYVIREGAAEDARNSIKVYGEASPYADSLNETKVIQTMIGTMNNALSKADAFSISNDELIRIENYITNKYKTDLEAGEIAANIAYAFAHMQQDKLDTDYENMMNFLLNIGDEVIKKSNMIDPASKELYDQVRATVSSRKFKLSDAERAEISSAFGGSWKAAFGAMQKAGIKLDNKNGSSIDTVFSEIREDMLKAAGVDISFADKPSQQILSIIDTMTALEPTPYLWDGANDLDKALTVVSDIVDQYYSIATEQLEANVAKGTKKGNDKIKKAIDAEKAKLRGQWAKYKTEKTEEFNSIVAEKNQIIQQQQNQIRQQEEQIKQWNKDAKVKDRAVILDKRQMEATAKLQAKQAVQNYKDREERARQIENIKKTGIRLIKWLDNPTDNQHVPAFLQRPLAEFLAAIDFLPTNAKANSKSTLTWQQRMQDLRETLVKIKDAEIDGDNSAEAYFAQNMIAKELISMMDDFLGKEEFDEFTQSYIVRKRAAKKVSLLDAKELATLNKIMSALSASINNMNKTYANNVFKEISALAKESAKEIDNLPAKKDMQKMVGSVFNFLNFDEVEPITYFEGLGKGAKSVFQELRDGFNLKTKHVREADKYMEEAKKELGISDKELSTWKNQLHTFKLTEGTVMLNTTQIMSLYKILGRKQGRPHVAVGGIKAADFEYKDGKVIKKHHQAKAAHIRATEAQAIIDTLTDEQKALADKMQEFMAKDCAAWGNRVTEKMFGYKKYEEKDYFPLKTDAHSRATTASSDNNVSYYTIKNSSFTKPITPMANNAVVLDDIFDVFTDHVVSMADYDAYVMPIADAMRWFNYSERVINAIAPDELNEQGARMDYLGNMQESIDRVYGDAGLSYFKQFIKDINGDYAGRGGKSEILSSLMSMYKAQAVGANMRVVIQQPTAVVRAADQIEAKYLLKALTSIPKAIEYAKKAQSNSEIAYWKAQGYYETYLGQSFKEIITGDTTLKDKFNDWSGFLAGQADDLSWGIMYRACEIKVSEIHPELTGTAYDKAVTKMFEDIVDHTQVVDTIFHKSQWMRSQELGHKVTSAFMAEPTKTYNMLYRAYRDAKLSGDKSFAIKRLRQVALIFLFEQLLNAMITGGWDALRDDEKENYIKSFLENFSENALDNLNPLNLLPIAKEITSAIQGYDATAYTTDAIYTAVDSFNVLVKIAQGKSTRTLYGNIYQIAKAASQLTGVPVANVMREFKTLYNLVNDFWGGKDLVNTQSIQKKVEKNKETKRISAIFETGDLSAMKSEITNTYNKAIADGKSESDAWKASRDMLKTQYQIMLEEKPEEKASLNNRFKTLLKYTKQSDGKGGYRALTDKEIANKLESWGKTEED